METTVPSLDVDQPLPSANRSRRDPRVTDRTRLLEAVARIGPKLAQESQSSEREGRLGAGAVDALRSNGLWRLRLCRELGGLELSIVDQIEIIAALAEVDTSSAWCTMVANSSVAVLGATMPDDTVHMVFDEGVPACSIVAAPGGRATKVSGGYRLSGTWRLASGIHHADWVHAPALIDGDPSRLLPFAVPVAEVRILDSWRVVGLSATGSNDFLLDDHFVPFALAGREDNPYGQVRGTRRYDLLGLDRVESYEHLAFSIGVARRALRELRQHLAAMPSGRHTADREVVQTQLARGTLDLHAVEALAASTYAKIDAAATGHTEAWNALDVYLPRALAVRATEVAMQCTQLAFQRAGVAALRGPNILEKLVRDMSVAATHIMVDDVAIASYGQHLLETSDLSGPARAAGGSRHAG